ncbi:PRC-barrel domain-containing protein [Cyanobacterium stanieri LEGE 03274]|uniref:PRC-barrel domain-containing protein n=1 Tax=Cyanobacterium stanieri LEGE 03274 TaxID=1828756 RepID=A0ABR9V7W8_9CHRO|nr:PRC-barrel domain-containing protein [Cyanobacterium stanieri]MBE9223221.1 PRC-barrel domain-containing protein [Cyanobacterium stanieri LEGE 03274]
MASEQSRLRNEFLNTQVITRSTGKRLGVIKEVLVDVDRREVVAFGLRDNMLALSGIPKYMYIDSVSQTGDVVLVESEDAIEDIDIELYSPLINCEVVTETGEPLGKVRDFQFNQETGEVDSLTIATLGYPQIPDQLISTYELSVDEIVSSGPNRIIVFEGAEERITQITVGVLERLGIGRPPWEKDDDDMYYAPTTPPENQLPTGMPVRPVAPPIKSQPPVREDNWEDDKWEEVAPVNPPVRRQRSAPLYEEEFEGDNWGEDRLERPSPSRYEPSTSQVDSYNAELMEEDVWDDEDDYRPQKVNIPQKQKMPEYEEEY